MLKPFFKVCICFIASACNYCFAQQLQLVLPIGHTGKLYEARFSPDGKKVVTASKDNTAKIWDVSSGSLLADLKGHTDFVIHAQFSPDGKKVLTQSYDITGWKDNQGRVKIWDAESGKYIADLTAEFGITAMACFSPDSKMILTIADSGKIWDAVTGKLLLKLQGQTNSVSSIHFSPDGVWIAAAFRDNSLQIFNAKTGKTVHRYKNHTSLPRTMQFSPSGKKLITASFNETITWDVAAWRPERTVTVKINGDLNEFNDDPFFFTPDLQKMIVADYRPGNKAVMVWDAATRKLIQTKKGNASKVENSETMLEDGGPRGNVAAASGNSFAAVLNTAIHNNLQLGPENEKTAYLWTLDKGLLVDSLTGHTDAINFMQFNNDGTKLVTASDDGTAKIWDAGSGKLLADLRSHTFNSRAADFSPENVLDPTAAKKMITASDDGTLKTWDRETGTLLKVFSKHDAAVFSVHYSRNGRNIVSGSQDGTVIVWDANSGKHSDLKNTSRVGIDPTAEPDLESVTRLVPPELSPDGLKLLTAIQSPVAKIFDATNGNLLFERTGTRYPGMAFAHFSNDGSKIITGWSYYDNEPDKKDTNTVIMDANTGKLLFKIESTASQFSSDDKKIFANTTRAPGVFDATNGKFLFGLRCDTCSESTWGMMSPDGKKIFSTDWQEGNGYFWNAENGKFLYSMKSQGSFTGSKFSPDSRYVLNSTAGNGMQLWDATNGNFLQHFKGHTDIINYFGFSPDAKNIISTSRDNTSKLWDAKTGKCLYTFFAVDSADYFIQLPSGYYKSTPDASKLLHYVTKDLKVISFEQLDVKYNRPDLVLEAIGNTDTNLIHAYRHAYYKRIKKLGIDTTAFLEGYSVPEADFLKRGNIALEQQSDRLLLHISGRDSIYKLDRYNLWVNEVPVFGQKGISLLGKNSKNFDATITIQLSQGENRIETSVTNVNGTESYRMPLLVNYAPPVKQKENIHFIGIGIDKFGDAKYNLNYSAKDIRDLAVKLKEKYGNGIRIDTLFNQHVTIANVKALKQKLLQTGVNDKVIISYSGHGLLSKECDYYLSTYSINFSKPQENGLPYDELEDLLDSIPARKKLLMIDACHSGELDKEGYLQFQVEMKEMTPDSTNNAVSRGVIVTGSGDASKKIGVKNSYELMQNLFVNVSKRTGATIISAAAGTEFALEKGDLKNGVFTYCVMEAMDKYPTMKISELKKTVGARVEELTKGMQKPTSRNEAIAVDWNIW